MGAACGSLLSLLLIFVINKQAFGWTIQLYFTPAIYWQTLILVLSLSLAAAAELLVKDWAAREPESLGVSSLMLNDPAAKRMIVRAEKLGVAGKCIAFMKEVVQAAQKQPGQIATVIDAALELFQDTFKEHNIQVRRVEETPLPPVAFDPKQVHQVLVNLLKNAVEAMPTGGEIIITSRVKGPNAEISVSDTGAGLTPEVAKNIFQPYFTTKEKGTGLGLAISQGIIQEHGGTILVDRHDLQALDWVRQNTSLDARFMINTNAWMGSMRRGVDGGYWLLPYAGRQTILPPVVYSYGAPAFVQQIGDWSLRMGEVTTCDEAFWSLVQEFSAHYLYLQEGQGSLQPGGLANCPLVVPVYRSGSVNIYEIAR